MAQRQTIHHHSLSQIIAEKITEEIITGRLQPGEKIVETLYAEEFGTSRAPVREALYLLQTQGLVERIPRKGTLVKGYSESEVKTLLEIRMMLESLAMKRLASSDIDEVLLNQMEQLIPLMEKAKQEHDREEYAQLNRKYHQLIIKMSKSDMIHNMYERLGLPLLSLQRISFIEEKNIEKSLKEHMKIVELIKSGQILEAGDILHTHNEEFITRIEASLRENG